MNLIKEYNDTIEYHRKRRELKALAQNAGLAYAVVTKSREPMLSTAQKVMTASKKMREEEKRLKAKVDRKYKKLNLLEDCKK